MKALNTKLTVAISSFYIFLAFSNLSISASYYSTGREKSVSEPPPTSVTLEKNNIRSRVWSNGVFNKGIINYMPGFEWPKETGKYAVYTSGFNIGAYVNGELRLATAYDEGEYSPGYCINNTFYTDSRFKLYKVSSGDNYSSNPDWIDWAHMVPYGAPYTDVNNSGFYEYTIDIPGVKDAAQTIFLCMTDGNTSLHQNEFPVYGKTLPLYAEVHLTAWVYDSPGLTDIQFLRWVVINKNISAWDSTLLSIIAETQIGNPDDDFIGYDTSRNMGFAYNEDNDDNGGSNTYGPNPPAFAMQLLNCSTLSVDLKAFSYFIPCVCGTLCEMYPTNSIETYRFLSGVKKDLTPWVIPGTKPPITTKFVYAGNPEAGTGWNYSNGRINNCGGSLTGGLILPGIVSDTRFIISTSPPNGRMNPGDTSVVQIAQFMRRGSNNLSSVTGLNYIADAVYKLCQNGFVIGINPLSNEVPNKFNLYQIYPNPFNPETKIIFDLPKSGNVTLKIYDVLGREVTTLINEKLNAGIYSVDWDASNFPSGVYFCKIESENLAKTIKMLMIK